MSPHPPGASAQNLRPLPAVLLSTTAFLQLCLFREPVTAAVMIILKLMHVVLWTGFGWSEHNQRLSSSLRLQTL